MKTGNQRYTKETRRRVNQQRNAWKKKRNIDLVQSLKDLPCTDCGGNFPQCVMQFDHTGDKEFNVCGGGITHMSLKKLIAELAKCDIVCANCHCIRTYARRVTAVGVLTESQDI